MGLGEGTIPFEDLFSEEGNPEFHEFAQYLELNPAFGQFILDNEKIIDPRVVAEFERIFYKNPETQEEHDEREVARRLKLFQIAIRAKIEQLLENGIWSEKGGSTELEFREAPRTFLKTIQEVLSHPTERMIFTREDLIDPQRLQAAIESIIIDPRRISNTLLRNLGLEQYIPPKRTRQEKQLEIRAQAIPAIKEMLRKLEPVRRTDEMHVEEGGLKYFRMMRMTEGTNEGYILGTQHIEGEKIIFKTDIHGAKRRLLHVEAGYEEEIRKLKWIEMTLKSVRTRLEYWSDVKHSEELATLKEALVNCVDSLEFVRSRSKRRLRAKVAQCMTLHDRRGRPNPGAAQASITSGLHSLGNRLGEIERISTHLGKDRAKVHQLIEEQEAPMERFLGVVEGMHDRFRILRREPHISEEEKPRIIWNLKLLRAEAVRLDFEPHLSFGKKFAEQIDKVIQALEEGRYEDAAKEFIKIYIIAKIKRSHTELQEVYERLSVHPKYTDPQILFQKLEEINRRLSAQLVRPEIDTAEYDAAYGEIYHLFNSLRKRLRELMGEIPVDPEEAEPVPGRRITLDDIIEEVQRRMPKIGRFLDKIRELMPQFIQRRLGGWSSPASDIPEETSVKKYSDTQKQKTYARMKQRLKEFDFARLVSALP